MTQLESARAGRATPELIAAAEREQIPAEELLRKVCEGRAVILSNRRPRKPCPIGEGLRTKVNANIGTSPDYVDIETELEKLRAAEEAGADTVMDLSTGGDIPAIRKTILERANVPVGTVPIYEVALDGDFTAERLFEVIRQHAKDGVDFVTVHCGVTRASLETLSKHPRLCHIVSRGGAFLAKWMRDHGRENPLYERYDELLGIAREYDVTLSLGDGLRPGSIADALDPAQVHELMIMAELCERARKAGVQAMVEGPGHVPLHQIEAQVKMQKELTKGAPFYVLGPLVTDVAPGYDHITAAIGGALAAAAGADFLCYVTPTEHLGLPKPEHVRAGVVAARIAAHAGDIAKGVRGAAAWDRQMSLARRQRDWTRQIALSLDPAHAAELRHLTKPGNEEVCSMCGKYCVFKLSEPNQEPGK